MSYRELVGDWIQRKLHPGEPNTFIEGGGTQDRFDRFSRRKRKRERLEKYERVYKQGGPVSQLIDTRALMTFGTGSEFVTQAEETVLDPETGDQLTVADWLDRQLPHRDNLFVTIARDNYIYGDSFQEIVRRRDNGFSHIVTVNPKTMQAEWDNQGTIREWRQVIEREGMPGKLEQTFQPEEIGHIALERLGRHPLGVSLLGRNWDEIQRFAKNQEFIHKTLERHGMRKWHVQLGREGGQPLDDNEVRRARSRFRNIKENDAVLTGRDVEINPIDEAASIGDGISNISENDLTMLAAGFGVPEEMAGLGRGSTEATAKVRLQAFERTARAEQRAMVDQFIDQVIRPVLEEFSPFPRDIDIDIQFGDVVSDQAAVSEWLRDFKASYTHNQVREKFGDGPVPEESDIDGDAPASDGEEGGMGGGLFDMQRGPDSDFRQLNSPDIDAWEAAWETVIEHALWTDDTERQLFSGFDDQAIPGFVKDRLREAVLGGAVFSDFESVPSGAANAISVVMLDSLEEQHGWSIDSIASNLREEVPELDANEAERIARTETQALVADAREQGYREQFDIDEERFKWVGPSDGRTTEACEWIKAQIPDEGVHLDELKALVEGANERFIDHAPRELTPHINCRHQFVRAV